MIRESLQGLSDLEPLPAEADADTRQQVSESEPEVAATEPAVQVEDRPTATPETPAVPRRRRLGHEETPTAEEADPDAAATEPGVTVQETPTATSQKPATPHRRRLGREDAPVEGVETNAARVMQQPMQARSSLAGLRAEQNLILGLAGGAIAAVAGAILWATVTIATGLQIGWMAIGVGAMVGGTMRVLGKGITKPFGCIGATLSLLGCLAGNLLSVCVVVARQHELPLTYVLTHLNPAAVPEAMAVAFHPMDLLFYGLAVYAAYWFAFRRVSAADLASIASNRAPRSAQTPVA